MRTRSIRMAANRRRGEASCRPSRSGDTWNASGVTMLRGSRAVDGAGMGRSSAYLRRAHITRARPTAAPSIAPPATSLRMSAIRCSSVAGGRPGGVEVVDRVHLVHRLDTLRARGRWLRHSAAGYGALDARRRPLHVVCLVLDSLPAARGALDAAAVLGGAIRVYDLDSAEGAGTAGGQRLDHLVERTLGQIELLGDLIHALGRAPIKLVRAIFCVHVTRLRGRFRLTRAGTALNIAPLRPPPQTLGRGGPFRSSLRARPVRIPVAHGYLEALLKEPEGVPHGAAVVCHPHPLYGGRCTPRPFTARPRR